MTKDHAPQPGTYDPYNPKLPEALMPYVVESESNLPDGYELLYRVDKILEPTPTSDGRTTLDVLLENHGYTIKLVPEGGGFRIYTFVGLKAVE